MLSLTSSLLFYLLLFYPVETSNQLQAPASLALCVSLLAAPRLLDLDCEPPIATWPATLKHEAREKGEGCQHGLIRTSSPTPQLDHSETHPGQLHRRF